MNYKKKRLTDAQFKINNDQKYDSKITDNFLRECGLNPQTFTIMAKELVQARLAAVDLLKNYSNLLNKHQTKALNKFKGKTANKKKCNQLSPTLAYPILNLATKIKRQAHKQEVQARQTIQELRYNQP
ncbi:hypothetical protein A8O14_10215 [Polynucleobacter wuianus]|uniref:Uncharacterized protein n=1 Tax=Polynucleobacter wuianus TaxID=1743168 RepID=A0A191UHC3_9BURK|nr:MULTISPECIES: hypothetical protein [Polynucleobacter]ANJ00414.1 hypothetical protein A8O14_10215 [Polynucleobacter wuianus]MBU3552994.1 hypothetical protein [Polynucleobacter sp. MWH-Post4-6-1]